MKIIYLISLTLLASLGYSNSFEDLPTEIAVYTVVSLLIILVIVAFIISIMFILSQQKLAKRLSIVTNTPQINPAWLWTQLIPIWSFVALVVTANKLKEQNNTYAKAHTLDKGPFKANYVYWYVGLVISTIIPVVNIVTGIANLVMFVFVWANIIKSSKILIEKNTQITHNLVE